LLTFDYNFSLLTFDHFEYLLGKIK